MTVDKMIARMPTLATVVSESWLRRNKGWFEAQDMPLPVWYEQLNRDLAILESWVGKQKLVKCYRRSQRGPKNL